MYQNTPNELDMYKHTDERSLRNRLFTLPWKPHSLLSISFSVAREKSCKMTISQAERYLESLVVKCERRSTDSPSQILQDVDKVLVRFFDSATKMFCRLFYASIIKVRLEKPLSCLEYNFRPSWKSLAMSRSQ